MRHSGMAALPNTAAQTLPLAGPAVTGLLEEIRTRAERVTHDTGQATAVRAGLQHRLDSWHAHRAAVTTGRLGYEVGADIPRLLVDPDTRRWDLWAAPRRLRDGQPQVSLQLDQ